MLAKRMPAFVNRAAKRALRTAGYARYLLCARRVQSILPPDEQGAREALLRYSPPRGNAETMSKYLLDASLDVSIIVPAYNAEKTVAAALSSALAQETDCTVEVVAVDDCSTDGTAALLTSLQGVRALQMEANGGRAAACRLGVMNARGRYLLFLDADDRLPKDAVQRLFSAAEQSNADIALGQYRSFFEDDGPRYQSESYPAGVREDSAVFWRVYPGYNCMKLYARALWLDACFLAGNIYDDTVLWYVIFPRCKKLVCIRDTVYEYRVSQGGLTFGQRGNPRAMDAYWAVEQALLWREEHGMKPDAQVYRMTLKQLSRFLFSRNKSAPEEALKSAFLLSCAWMERLKKACGEIGLHGMDRALERAFLTRDFGAWRFLCAYLK